MTPIANYTTSVEAINTVEEIQGMLVAHGARQILMNYDNDGILESLSFIIGTPHGMLPFRLPVNAQAVLKVLERDRVPAHYRTHPQAVKVAWRIIRDWVRAQMALLETEMVRLEQIFLPYMMTPNNKTLCQPPMAKASGLAPALIPSGEGETIGKLTFALSLIFREAVRSALETNPQTLQENRD